MGHNGGACPHVQNDLNTKRRCRQMSSTDLHLCVRIRTPRMVCPPDCIEEREAIASVLSEKGYECFLPLYSKRTVWSDRIKVTSLPCSAVMYFPGLMSKSGCRF